MWQHLNNTILFWASSIFLFILLSISPLFSSAQIQYLIEGEIKELKENDKVYLIVDHVDTDSSVVTNGKFKFTGKTNHSKIATLGIYEKNVPTEGMPRFPIKFREFYLSSAPILVKGDELSSANIKGDELNIIYSKYWFENDSLRNEAMVISSAFTDNVKNGTLTDERAIKHQENLVEYMKSMLTFDISFLANNTPSLFSADLIERHLNQENVLQLEDIFNKIPFTPMDSSKKDKIAIAINRYKKLAVGSKAPAFTLRDIHDKEVSLESFKGKIVLLDFWASWCIPCRKENPRYLAIYEKFKNKNFEIVAVSLNKEKEKELWFKAIHEDKITEWTHLSDLKGHQSPIYELYEVKGLPHSYLLDENGIIIGHNLKGDELETKLDQILK